MQYSSNVQEAAEVIKKGGLVVCPTEGVYGISCNMEDHEAVERLINLKRRDIGKGLIVVDSVLSRVINLLDARHIGVQSYALMMKMWPGPHTFVVPVKKGLNNRAIRADNTMALRVTAFKTMMELCDAAGSPLISTSANLSGNPSSADISSIDKEILEGVDLVLNLPCGGQIEPTSIYDIVTDTLIRKGPHWSEND